MNKYNNLRGLSILGILGNTHPLSVNIFACRFVYLCAFPRGLYTPGLSRITEVTIREQMIRMTSRAMAIPFQFL